MDVDAVLYACFVALQDVEIDMGAHFLAAGGDDAYGRFGDEDRLKKDERLSLIRQHEEESLCGLRDTLGRIRLCRHGI